MQLHLLQSLDADIFELKSRLKLKMGLMKLYGKNSFRTLYDFELISNPIVFTKGSN